ncbi:MAG: helix-turn-helix transcriptional regulator [Candidatus Obscuribacterales bacterium]|nr:helix-turn-helix transcriptional regulator [Candidatus Obscuribacterales bacterium]
MARPIKHTPIHKKSNVMTQSSMPSTKCPIDITVQFLSNKWTIPIIRELMSGPKRPSDLERKLKGISAKTLSERLHDLQTWGLVLRRSHPEVPPRVEYSLTEIGRELERTFDSLKQFGVKWQFQMNQPAYGGGQCESCPETVNAADCPATEDLSAKRPVDNMAVS